MRAKTAAKSLVRALSTNAAPVSSKPLRVVAVLGSTRITGPPSPAPLGARVGAWISECARARGLDVDVVDPIEEDLPLMRRPHFAYAPGKAPPGMDELSARLRAADAYVMVSPE